MFKKRLKEYDELRDEYDIFDKLLDLPEVTPEDEHETDIPDTSLDHRGNNFSQVRFRR